MFETKAAFARRCGVSKAAVTKAVAGSRIGLASDGTVDLKHPDTIAFWCDHPGTPLDQPAPEHVGAVRAPSPPAKAAKPKRPGRKNPRATRKNSEPEQAATVKAEKAQPPAQAKARRAERGASSHQGAFDFARDYGPQDMPDLKVHQMVQTIRITKDKADAQRNGMIPRKVVQNVFNRLAAIDGNEFKALEDRLAPTICGIFGESADSDSAVHLRELLGKEITKVLRHRKRTMGAFLTAESVGL